MKVRMLVSIAGNPNPQYGMAEGFSYRPGEAVDLHPTLAAHWIASGNAAAITEDSLPAKRTKKKQEKE
jgi:hypothetical protein